MIFIAGSVGCGIHSVTLGAFNDWDLLNYQYYSPYALLNGRLDFDYAPAQIQTFLNPVPFVPFYLVTTLFKPAVAGFIMGALHGLAAGFLFLTALAVFSSLAPMANIVLSILCAATGIYGPSFIGFLGSSGADHIASLFVIAGVYVLIRAIRIHGAPDVRGARSGMLFGGVLIGIAAGLKLTCGVFLIGYGVALLLTGRGFRSRLTSTGLFGIAGLIGILISRGHWMLSLWSRFGSPLFPFYNSILKSPYYYDKNFSDNRFLARTMSDAFMLPFRYISKNHYTIISRDFRDLRYALVYGLILAGLVALATGLLMLRMRRPISKYRLPDRAEVFLLLFFVVSYAIMQVKFGIMRYAVPLELIAPILIAVLIRLLLPWKMIQQIGVIAAFAAIALIMQPWHTLHRSWSSAYIEVEAPRLDSPDETLVILAGSMPWSYLIPSFQPEVRFLGLATTFSHPGARHPHRASVEMRDLVKSHDGPIYILSDNQRIAAILEDLMPYNIVLSSGQGSGDPPGRVSINDIEGDPSILPVSTEQQNTKLFLWPAEISRKPRRSIQKKKEQDKRRDMIKSDRRRNIKKR